MKRDPRKEFARVFAEIGKENEKVLSVSCDSASGGGLDEFNKAFPDRYVEVGISEQNAIGICAGLAKMNFIPVVVAITPFITMRCYEQIRNDLGYSKTNVKIVGSGAGLQYSTLGSSHEAVEDVAVIRTIPNMTVLSPGDAYEIEMCLKEAVKLEGPVYIRMPRHALNDIKPASERNFRIGKGEILKEGKNLTIFTYGTMVNEVMEASEILSKYGIYPTVVDLCTIKPLDAELVLNLSGKSDVIVTVEEHSVVGGIGSAIAEIICEEKKRTPLYKVGVEEGAVNTGPYRELLKDYGLTGETLAVRIREIYEISNNK
jgi:transketolase